MSYVEAGYLENARGYVSHSGSRVEFQSGAQTITIERAPQRPPRSLELVQAEAQSAGAVRFGFDPVTAVRRRALLWPRLHAYDHQKIRDFFLNVAGGMAETFVYVDPLGVSRTVRFAEPELSEARTITPDRVEFGLTLEEA